MLSFDETQYAEATEATRQLFDAKYGEMFHTFSEIAHLELPKEEQEHFGTLEHPKEHPDDGRDAKSRFLFGYGKNIRELAYRFGTHLEPVRPDGTWNFKVMRRYITAEILPLQQALQLSAFVFEDRGSQGDHDRHGRSILLEPISLTTLIWPVEDLLAYLWGWAVNTQRENLVSQYWDKEFKLVPIIKPKN